MWLVDWLFDTYYKVKKKYKKLKGPKLKLIQGGKKDRGPYGQSR